MKLLRLEMKRFGRFDDFAIDFTDGLNVLCGENESGKSTVFEAITTALFDDPTRPAGDSGRFQHWLSGHPYLLHLEYETHGRKFHLTKDVSTGIVLLEEIESGTKWNTWRDVQAQLASHLGFSDKTFFVATAAARQDDLAGVGRAADLIKDRLERLLNTNKDEVLASRLLERLKNRIDMLLGSGAEAGEIAQLEKRIAGWQGELATAKFKTAELLEARTRAHAVAADLHNTEKQFEDRHERFRKSKLAFEASQALEKDREVYADLNRRTLEALEIKNLITARKESLKSMTRIERADLRSCESLETQKQIYRGRVEDCEARVQQEEDAFRKAPVRGWYRWVALVALSGAAVAGAFWHKIQDPLLLASAAAAFLTAVTAISLYFGSVRVHRQAQTRYDDARRKADEERENLRKNSETLDALLRRFRAKDVEDLSDKYEQFRDLDREIKTMVSRYESILGENNLKDLELDLAKMTERMNEYQQTFEQHRAFAISGRDLEELQREVAELDKKLSRLRDENIALGHKLEFLESGTDTMAPLQERVEEDQRSVELLRREAEQLQIVFRYLEEARRKVLKSSFEMLEDEASTVLSRLTLGNWNRLRFDRQSLHCEISHDGAGWRHAADSLSRSAVDALYLAIRLALVKVLCPDSRPPLLLDEPLTNFDNARRGEANRVLQEFAQQFQILLLTADERARQDSGGVRQLSVVAGAARL